MKQQSSFKATAEQIRWFRLYRSGLIIPFESPEQAASALIGAQAQFLVAGMLALWNRTRGLNHEQMNQRLLHQRTLVKLWGQRHTLHLYPSSEWPLIYAALKERQTWWERQLGPRSPEVAAYHQLVAQTEELLREKKILGRSDLRTSALPFNERHLDAWGGIFAELVRRGTACHIPMGGNEGKFAYREQWLPHLVWNPPTVEAANIEIARRYFHTYGPSTMQDFAYWRGTTLLSARRYVSAFANELTEIEVGGQHFLLFKDDLELLAQKAPPRDEWPVRLLYRFDSLLLAHKDKSWLIDAADYKQVWRAAGHIEGTILEYGRLVGTWRYHRQGNLLLITLSPFDTKSLQSGPIQAAVLQQAQGVADFFGMPWRCDEIKN